MTIQYDNTTNSISVVGSDTNIDLNLTPKGTGAVVANGPFTATGASSLGGVTDVESLKVSQSVGTVGSNNYIGIDGSTGSGTPTITSWGTNTNVGMTFRTRGASNYNFATASTVANIQFRISNTTSAVNYVQATGAVTGGAPTVSAQGSDTNVNLSIASKGSGVVFIGGQSSATTSTVRMAPSGANAFFVSGNNTSVNYLMASGAPTGSAPQLIARGTDTNISVRIGSLNAGSIDLLASGDPNAGTGALQMRVAPTASAVNFLQVTGAATGGSTSISAQGADTNVPIALQTKGTGALNLAAGSSGVNISNGTTVTAITRTANGSGYTSIPSVAISAPTTAGGVQATATANLSIGFGWIFNNAGTGYAVNDVITIVGGTGISATFGIVSIGAGGSVTGIVRFGVGSYSVLPPSPSSTTTNGSGTGFTITNFYEFASATITNAGSGYVEQPTVTFSGGDGSGAAASASVGAAVSLRSLGGGFSFFTPVIGTTQGEAFRVYDFGGSTWVGVRGHTGATAPAIFNAGSANVGLDVVSNGTGPISIRTGGTVTNNGVFNQLTQLSVTHTASAVNFVQVTGAATGGRPRVEVAGSDTNIDLRLNAKGNGGVYAHSFFVAGANNFNNLTLNGAATGSGVRVSASGGDTNIPLALQPKGTGALQAQAADSTATGGNARGANAVDWQAVRGNAAQVSSGTQAVIGGGTTNTSSGFVSTVAGGQANTASNNYTFIGGGLSNTASLGFATIAGGHINSAAGFLNFIGGGFTNSGTSGATVTTQATSAVTSGSTTVTLSASNASIRVGQLVTGTGINSFPNTYVSAISGTTLTLSQNATATGTPTLSFFTPHGVVVGGGNNQATGSYSFIGGGGDAGTAANRNVASGAWSVVVGGARNTASGVGSVVAGGGFNSSGLPTGANIASGNISFIGNGSTNTASSAYATVTNGFTNTANGTASSVVGGASGTTRSIVGNIVFPANFGAFSFINGVHQAGLLVLARQTTDDTATALCSDGQAAGTTNQVILPNNSAYFFRGEVISGVTGGGDTKGWTIEGVVKRGANAASTTLVGTPTVTSSFADAGASTWDIAVTADTTNGGLRVTFTGQAATTIRTVAQIRTTEMTY
jgi:hypothetical protein